MKVLVFYEQILWSKVKYEYFIAFRYFWRNNQKTFSQTDLRFLALYNFFQNWKLYTVYSKKERI